MIIRNTFGATLAALTLSATVPAHAQFVADRLWSFNHGSVTSGRSSEIVKFDPLTGSLWVVGGNGIDVLTLGGTRALDLGTTSFGVVNSLAIRGDVAAVSFSNGTTVTDNGRVEFFRTGSLAHLGGVTVGAVPDMVTWTLDGRLLVANEGERQNNVLPNPVGSVSIIDFNAATPSASTVTTAGFDNVPLVGSVRLQPGVSAPVGLEPEYIALDPKGGKAIVTLQEASAFALLNLVTNTFEKVVGLGAKDFSLPGNAIDPSNQDGRIELRNVPVKGLYMPDTVTSFVARNGKTYYVTANEGDSFVDDADTVRVGNSAVVLDSTAFPDSAAIKNNANLGRLNISRFDGLNAQGQYNALFAIGARSFAIWDEDGKLVKDSGDAIERELLALDTLRAANGLPRLYDDDRSDDKGVEPEGLFVKTIGERTYAFVGLERTTQSVIAVFDITDPEHPRFMQFIVGAPGERRPEGLDMFESNGMLFLAVAQEDPSNITTLYRLTEVPEPSTYALMLAGLAALGFAARRRRPDAPQPA
jgi:hypothetical protein